MFSPKMEKALNAQVQEEFYSSYLYLSMAAHFAHNNLKGFSHWMKLQSAEERGHAMKLYEYIIERGGHLVLQALSKPTQNFKSILEIMEKTLEHEQKITAQIHKLYELAGQDKDYATQVMLQWFVTEQVEEEAGVLEIIAKLKMLPDKGGSILYLDKELGKRTA